MLTPGPSPASARYGNTVRLDPDRGMLWTQLL